jgi:hypothetical protein
MFLRGAPLLVEHHSRIFAFVKKIAGLQNRPTDADTTCNSLIFRLLGVDSRSCREGIIFYGCRGKMLSPNWRKSGINLAPAENSRNDGIAKSREADHLPT